VSILYRKINSRAPTGRKWLLDKPVTPIVQSCSFSPFYTFQHVREADSWRVPPYHAGGPLRRAS